MGLQNRMTDATLELRISALVSNSVSADDRQIMTWMNVDDVEEMAEEPVPAVNLERGVDLEFPTKIPPLDKASPYELKIQHLDSIYSPTSTSVSTMLRNLVLYSSGSAVMLIGPVPATASNAPTSPVMALAVNLCLAQKKSSTTAL